MDVIVLLLQSLLEILFPFIRRQIDKAGDRRLPLMIFYYGIFFYVLGGLVMSSIILLKVHKLVYVLPWYILIGFVCILILYILSLLFEPYVFYFVVLPLWGRLYSKKSKCKIKRFIYNFFFSTVNVNMLEIIWKSRPDNSMDFVESKKITLTRLERKFPLVIRAIDLEWPFLKKKMHQSFAILLLPLNDKEPIIEIRKSTGFFNININLKNYNLGIYNNLGKEWLNYFYNRVNAQRKLADLDTKIHNCLMGKSTQIPDISDIFSSLPPHFFLRWSSGGGLIISRYKEEPPKRLENYWVILFFRDIFPIGWNVGNGASESREEYVHISRLCARELCEEYVIVDDDISSTDKIKWYPFKISEPAKEREPLLSPVFQQRHIVYRKRIDGISFSPDEKDITKGNICRRRKCIVVSPIETNINIFVNLSDFETEESDLLFSINPYEFGIETIALMFVELLNKDLHIIDGEFHSGRNILIRRPVALINLGWLYDIFRQNGNSLGEEIKTEKLRKGGKLLPPIPIEKIKLFLDDIPLRQRRLKKLIEHNEISNESYSIISRLCGENFLRRKETLSFNMVNRALEGIRRNIKI